MHTTKERSNERMATGGHAPRVGALLGLLLALAGGAEAAPHTLQGAARANRTSTAEFIERELAEVELVFELERDPAAAQAQLEALAARAADPAGFVGQGRALASVALARAGLLAQLGRPLQALAVLELSGPDPAAAPGSSLSAALAEARADARVAALAAELSPANRTQETDGDPVLRDVRRLFEMGAAEQIREPSRAQVRALEALVVESLEGRGTLGAPALSVLLAQAPLEAAAFLRGRLATTGEAFHRQVLRHLVERNPLTAPGAWIFRGNEPPVLLEPIWRELLETLVVHEGARRGALPLLAVLAQYDALTPPLVEALRTALFSAQPDLVKEAYLAIADLPGVACVKPLYEALLVHPEPALRHSAARTLANYEDLGRLLEVVDSEDILLRGELARALGRRNRVVVAYSTHSSPGRTGLSVPTWSPAEELAIVRLCADPDPSVRGLAVGAAVARQVELPREVLLALTAEQDPNRLDPILGLRVGDARLLGEFLVRLAPTPHPRVARGVATRLGDLDWAADPESLWPALAAFLERSAVDPAQRRDLLVLASKGVWSSKTATAALVRWTLASADPVPVETAVEAAAAGRTLEGFSALSPAELIELLARRVRSARIEAGSPDPRDLLRAIGNLSRLHPSFAFLVAASGIRELPLDLRTRVLAQAFEGAVRPADWQTSVQAAILDLLADRRWSEGDPESSAELRAALEHLDMLAANARGDLWNGVVAASLAEREAPHRHLDLILQRYEPLSAGGKEIAHAILARWPVDGETFHGFVAKTLRHGRELSLDPGVLVRGLERYPSAVVGALSRWRDPVFLAPLARALEPDWIDSASEREQVRRLAAQGLANQLSDEAARVLLEGSERTGDEELRKLCFEGLETIRTFQEARERFERRVAERAARARALESLLSLLEDADPVRRAAGLLALGELGDAQVLPRIAALAADGDASVRAAALEALRRLRPAPELPEAGPASGGGAGD